MSEHFPQLFIKAGADGPEISNAFVLWMLSRFRLQAALDVLDAWEKDFPRDARPHVLRGRVLRVVRNWKDAENQYALALKLDPKLLQARFQMAHCQMQQLQYEKAESELRQCLKEDANHIGVIVALTICLRKQKKIDAARKLFQTHKNAIGNHAEALREFGRLELAEERPQAALKYLRRAVKLNPADRESHYVLAQALLAVGQNEAYQKEIAFVSEATKPMSRLGKIVPKLVQEPQNLKLRFEIAEITWKYKSRDEGAKWFRSLLQFDADHLPTHRALLRHYELADDKKKARQHRRHIVRIEKSK
ncbi:MAG: tetratricopeptide repeat protein [Planctomycetes bacterium]|nr:tetratricopeptide repeat protein [Planctomycetota bacterium]